MSAEAAAKGKNRTIIILVIIIGLILMGMLAIKIYQKIKEKKALEEAEKLALSESDAPAAGTGGGFGGGATLDEFPIKEGSKGERVKYIQAAINRIADPIYKVKEDGVFGHGTYKSLITGVGTKYYPVTLANYTELLKKSTSK